MEDNSNDKRVQPNATKPLAANENPAANENIKDKTETAEATTETVGSEITDGEDG
jgi:hypothetical protein